MPNLIYPCSNNRRIIFLIDETMIIYSNFRVVFFFCVMPDVVYHGIAITRDFIEASGRSKSNEFFLN